MWLAPVWLRGTVRELMSYECFPAAGGFGYIVNGYWQEEPPKERQAHPTDELFNQIDDAREPSDPPAPVDLEWSGDSGYIVAVEGRYQLVIFGPSGEERKRVNLRSDPQAAMTYMSENWIKILSEEPVKDPNNK